MEKRIIGITGGIGSGKSVVSRVVRLNGVPVYDCDLEAKKLMQSDSSLRSELTRLIGSAAYDAQGFLDRKYVASRIFSDPELLADVNALVHEAVRNHFCRFAASHKSATVFCESAILATSGMADGCTRIWLVDAPEGVRMERVTKRDGMTESQVRERMEAQRLEFEMLPKEKTLRIDNSGEHPLLPVILELIDNKPTICLEKYWR